MPKFHVHRSTEIAASPQRVFEAVADFGTWTTWSPWLCAEPDADVRVSDDASSVGSLYSWQGDLVGQGEIEHRRLEPGRLIEDEIRFIKPFRSQSNVSFDFEPAGDGTRITWHMRGSLPWFLFWMKPQMEVFIGMDYERGLKMLKEWLETGEIQSTTNIVGVEQMGPLQVAGIRRQCAIKDIGETMGDALCKAQQAIQKGGLPSDGEVVSVYHKFDIKAQQVDYTSGITVPASTAAPEGLSLWSLPETRALRVTHVGSYENLGNAWSAAQQFTRYKKLKQRHAPLEIYKNSPEDTPPAELRTEIFLPIK